LLSSNRHPRVGTSPCFKLDSIVEDVSGTTCMQALLQKMDRLSRHIDSFALAWCLCLQTKQVMRDRAAFAQCSGVDRNRWQADLVAQIKFKELSNV